MNIEYLKQVGIDYDAGLERFMNDVELYEAVLSAYIEDNIIERAKEAYKAGDREQLLNVVHEAKGSSGNAGLSHVYVAASALVAILRSQECTKSELNELYKCFEDISIKTSDGIKAALVG